MRFFVRTGKELIFFLQNTRVLSFVKTLEPRNVLAENVELDVHDASNLDVAEVGVLESVGDDGHLESVLRRVANRERHAIHRHAALVDGEIPAPSHRLVVGVLESEIGAAVGIFHVNAGRRHVHMPLHDVPVEPPVHQHRALHVHLVAHAKPAQVRALQRFLHRRHRVGVARNVHHRQADTVVSHALVDGKLTYKRTTQREIYILLVVLDAHDRRKFFNNTRKHNDG